MGYSAVAIDDCKRQVEGCTARIQRFAREERFERMQRNAAKLQQLAVQQRLIDLQEPVTSAIHMSKSQQRRSKAPAQQRPAVRTSARVRGIAADPIQPLTTGTANAIDTMQPEEVGPSGRDMMTQQEYMQYTGMQADSIASDGHFTGWVNAAVCQQCGIANSASDAWSQNAGGKFSFKVDKSAIPASLKAQGWSNARAFSATQLKQNPNTFFYRNVAPGEVQAFGDWSEDEHKLFLETAKKYGVGDKWGLFASNIPQRVGYQCSAYYRDVIIPACLVLDARFKLSAQGKAVFQG
ncbi:TPA: hypothetical protein ACH3X1_009025 [Trebouxia sp. C0004]